jgi:hypothetical protein
MLTWPERIDCYRQFCAKKKWPPALAMAGDWCYGAWLMGNGWEGSGYHGGYPPGYLPRIAAMFPDKVRVLHLFSGMVDLKKLPGDTVDIRADLHPTYVADAGGTMEGVPIEEYDLVVADPPYSDEDAAKYGTSLVNRNKVLAGLGARLLPGAHVVWLDQMLPMYSSRVFKQEALISLQRSTNHRFRCIVIFRRREPVGESNGRLAT